MMALRSTKEIPRYVQSHLLNTIVADPALVLDTPQSVRQGYLRTDDALIMDKSIKSDPTLLTASTAVTAVACTKQFDWPCGLMVVI